MPTGQVHRGRGRIDHHLSRLSIRCGEMRGVECAQVASPDLPVTTVTFSRGRFVFYSQTGRANDIQRVVDSRTVDISGPTRTDGCSVPSRREVVDGQD